MKHGSRRVPPKKETASLLGVCYDVVEVLVASLACIVLLFTFLFRVVGVEGDSMMDTLYGGDRLILCPALSSPDRGDIVVINRYTDEPLVKRVIGVAGDTLEIDEELHRVRLNGELLDEPYVQYPTPAYDMTGEVAVPEGYVFVMGYRAGAGGRYRGMGGVPDLAAAAHRHTLRGDWLWTICRISSGFRGT